MKNCDHRWNMRKEIEGRHATVDAAGFVRSPKLPGVELSRDTEDGMLDCVFVRMHCVRPGCDKILYVSVYPTDIVLKRQDTLSKKDQEIHRRLYK